MTEAAIPVDETDDAPEARGGWRSTRRLFGWAAILLGGAVLLAVLAVLALDTQPGRKLIVGQLSRIAPDSGLRVSAGRIDGSIYGKLVVRDLALSDPEGVFLTSPAVNLDWRPRAFLFGNRLDIEDLDADRAELIRLPKLNPSAEPRPLLPEFDIDIERLRIGQLVLGETITGKRQVAQLAARALVEDGRADITLAADSASGGDRLKLALDAMPDADRFSLSGELDAPRGGIVAGMTGLDRAITARLSGKGRWSRWQGQLSAALAEGEGGDLAGLRIDAADGRFRIGGRIDPAKIMGGVLDRLAPDGIRLNASAAPDGDVLPFILSARSAALGIDARGRLGRADSSLSDTRATIRLTRPGALVSILNGQAMRLQLNADGPLSGPDIAYRFTADWVSIGAQRLDDVVASGRVGEAVADGDLSLDARFQELTGAGDLITQLSQNARITGPLTLDDLVVRGQGTRLRTDMASASVNFLLDLKTGRYDVRGDGQLPDYPIPGLGRLAGSGKLWIHPDPVDPRKLRVEGPVSARLTRLDNDFLRFVFGGLPSGSGNMVRTPDGTVTLTDLKVAAPDFAAAGRAVYRLGQQINFTGRGRQDLFGPLDLELSGLISRPKAIVTVDSYQMGIPLNRVRAVFEPEADSYAFTAAGSTMFGPVTASGSIDTIPGAVRYRLDRAALAGVTARGVLTPSGSVPVSGTLALGGTGVSGSARFIPQGDIQRIDIAASLKGARLSLPGATTVRSGTVDADLRLSPEGNLVRGTYRLGGVSFGTLDLASASGAFDLTGGEGEVTADLTGRRGAPFTAKIAADVRENAVSVTGSGTISGDPVSLNGPARFILDEDGWRLANARIRLPRGQARIFGTFGDVPVLDVDLEKAGLGALSLALPGVELGGEATGDISLRFPPGGLPQGRARLRIIDFARESGILAQPIDLALVGLIGQDSAALRAAFEQDGRRIGRFQARLPSLPGSPTDLWIDRISAAPVSAQLRYRGPAEAIWPLGGIDAIGIGGPLAARIDIAGVVGDPSLTGTMTSDNLSFESVNSGTVIRNIDLAARFTGSRLQLERFSGQDTQGGAISGSGTVDLSLSRGFPIDVRLDTRDAKLIDIDTLDTRVTGPILIRNSPEAGARISGDLNVNRASYKPGNPAAEDIPELKVKEVNTALLRTRTEPAARTVWQLDVKAAANNRIFVRGLGLDSEWSAKLLIKGPVGEPRLSGQADLIRGDYDFAGRRFELTRGEVIFNGRYPPDPTLNIAAESRVEGLTATIAIRGLSTKPEITLSSVPSLPQDEILSRVLFGTSIANLSAPEALQLAGAVAALRGGGSSALDPIGSVRRAIGIDRLRITAANAATGQGTGVAAGEYLGRRTYVEVTADTDGNTATQIEYALTRAFSILGRVSSFGGNSIGVRVSKDY